MIKVKTYCASFFPTVTSGTVTNAMEYVPHT